MTEENCSGVTNFVARVDGWTYPRKVYLREREIFFLSTAENCFCNTCVNRFLSLVRSLDKRGISFDVGAWSKEIAIRLVIPEEIDLDIKFLEKFLSEKLDLRIHLEIISKLSEKEIEAEVKKFLSENEWKFNQSFEIKEGPVGCMLGITLFDQSPEVKMIEALPFIVIIKNGKCDIHNLYHFKVNKKKANICDGNIVTEGQVVRVLNDADSPVLEEKFKFLPEGSRVQIVYNQDNSTGSIVRVL